MLDYFLQQKISSGLKKYRREHCFLNYKDIKQVLILFDIEDWYEILPIVETLKKEGKRVVAWTVRPSNSQVFRFPHYVRVIEPNKDINWMKLLKPEVLDEFKRLNYETLMDLSSGQNEYILWLLSQNKSQFAVGLVEHEYKLYDFILLKDKEQSHYEAFKQMKNFLEHIE